MDKIKDNDLNINIQKNDKQDEWKQRLSPVELDKSSYYDEKFFNDNKDIINEISRNEYMLRKDPAKFNSDESLFLYRLAIGDKLREKIYNDILKEEEEKNKL